jgi:hypothetical protein
MNRLVFGGNEQIPVEMAATVREGEALGRACMGGAVTNKPQAALF